MAPDQAARVLLTAAGFPTSAEAVDQVVADPAHANEVFRSAARNSRPDQPGGSDEAFQLGRAGAVLDRSASSRAAAAAPSSPLSTPPRPPAPGGDRRLSLVIPAYREADRIGATVERIRAELAARWATASSRSWWSTTARATPPPTRPGGRCRPGAGPAREPGQGRRGAGRDAGRQRPDPGLHRRRPGVRPGPDRAAAAGGRGRLGRRGGQPPPRRHHHGGRGQLAARDRSPGDQRRHPRRAARRPPGHPVRPQGVPLRRGRGDLRPRPGRRVRVRRGALHARRALRPVAHGGPRGGRELRPVHGQGGPRLPPPAPRPRTHPGGDGHRGAYDLAPGELERLAPEAPRGSG